MPFPAEAVNGGHAGRRFELAFQHLAAGGGCLEAEASHP
jgi:hypothetical protein